MHKRFRLTAEQIKPLATGLGSCIASDRITVDGLSVGYMYREQSSGGVDSGWRFLGGDETPAYLEDSSTFELYEVNTIANYDTAIIPLLSAPAGSAFARNKLRGMVGRHLADLDGFTEHAHKQPLGT